MHSRRYPKSSLTWAEYSGALFGRTVFRVLKIMEGASTFNILLLAFTESLNSGFFNICLWFMPQFTYASSDFTFPFNPTEQTILGRIVCMFSAIVWSRTSMMLIIVGSSPHCCRRCRSVQTSGSDGSKLSIRWKMLSWTQNVKTPFCWLCLFPFLKIAWMLLHLQVMTETVLGIMTVKVINRTKHLYLIITVSSC